MPSPSPTRARLALELVIGRKRRADRAAGIAGRRLNPDVVELAVAQHLAVGDAIQRHAAGKAQIARAGLGREAARQPQHGLLEHRLDRGRDIHVERRQQLVRRAHRLAEQLGEPLVGHGQPGAIVEIGHVEPERAVRLEIDQIVENELCVFRLAIGREPHHLVFAGVDLEAGVIGERRIEQPERMGKVDLLEDLEPVALGRSQPTSSPIRRRRPWSAPRPSRTARERTPTPRGSDGAR